MTASTSARDEILISARELREQIAGGRDVVLLDIRYAPGAPSKRPEYEAGHLPGARWVELGDDLAGGRTTGSGNNPLPGVDALQRKVREWGIDDDSLVVVYGDAGAPVPARGWFVLTWAGVGGVRFLDGGIGAWIASGGELVTDEPAPGAGRLRVTPGSLPTIDADEAAAIARRGVLLDSRATKAYVGEGHIPGALSLPTHDHLDADGLLRSSEELRRRFADAGVDGAGEVAAYCGGGVAAAHQALVLRTLGIVAPVYIGSWSAWSADSARPVAVGAEAG